MNEVHRIMIPYIRRDSISWWAGVRDQHGKEIHETSCITRWGSKICAKRMARKFQFRSDHGTLNIKRTDV